MFFKIGTVLFHLGRTGVVIVLLVALCDGIVFLTEGVRWWFPVSFWHLGKALAGGVVCWGVGYFTQICAVWSEVSQALDV